MTDSSPKPIAPRKTGLSPKEQKLQALREKMAQSKAGAKPAAAGSGQSFHAKGNVARKTAFQRKAT
ncbi:MAG TPA: hypothetical protein VGN16_12890 [Acidobacteriaceae bacterium]|jgi:hypothetical protein